MSKEEKEELAEEIAKKVFAMKEEKEEREKEAARKSEFWEEGTDFLVCKPCSAHKDSPNLPLEQKKFKRGDMGMISKVRDSGERRPAREVRRKMKDHCEGNFHLWCVRKSEEKKVVTKNFEEENKEAGLVVINSFLKTIKGGGGAADFLKEVDFTHIIHGVPRSQKNNSRCAFFELRDDCFEVVTGLVQNLFKSGKVTELAATLDKVTVQHRSYTVLLTFFFFEGKIYNLLNSLLKMGEEDYDSSGTARLVINNMMVTLGLTRTQLARLQLHFRCDYLLWLLQYNLYLQP